MEGVEIGASAANPFQLKARNIDFIDHRATDSIYSREQLRTCGDIAPVDLLAMGDRLPLADLSVDFVVSSHVIEHFYDPVAALLEWVRVSRRFVYLIVPHKDRTFDRDRPVTAPDELIERHRRPRPEAAKEDRHWSVWRTSDFVALIERLGLPIAAVQDVDDKIGNGFAVAIGDFAHWDRQAWLDRMSQELAPQSAAFLASDESVDRDATGRSDP